MKPKVSVIIPNYNHAAYLNKRIQSILEQTFQNFEVLLLDDCSTDHSMEILNQYKNHPKVSKLLVNAHNSGSTFKQWQKGIQESSGEYIWIAESDDFADNLFLEKLLTVLEANPNVGIAYCQSWAVDMHSNIIGSCSELYRNIPGDRVYAGKEVIEHYMAGANLIPNASAVVFRSCLAKDIGNKYTQFKLSGDWYFWCALLLRADMIHVSDTLNYFRFHQNKVTVSTAKKGIALKEGLLILDILRKNKALTEETYRNKSKNWANSFVAMQSDAQRKLSGKIAFEVMWAACKINKLFVQRVMYLLFIKKFNVYKVR